MSVRSKRWLVWLLVLGSSQIMAADAAWRMATTPRYRLLSQLSDRESAAWMRGFDQFILSTSDVLQMDVRALPPLTVVIFSHDKDYSPYKLARPNGKTANVAGEFLRQPTWSMIGMAYDADTEELHRVIYHEATHWLMSADQARTPAWFSEGIAEMFSTFERHGDTVNWAKPITSHLVVLNGVGDMPLAQFLTEPSAIFDRDDRTERFYAQSWAFTHFLMLSKDPGRRQLLFKFLSTYKKQSGEATVETVFGTALKDIEQQFHVYVEQRSWGYMMQPAKPAAVPPALERAPPAFVEASLGFLALGAGREELARRHAEKAIELDANAPDGHAVLAYLALGNRDFDQAVTHAKAALERSSKDGDLFMVLGDSYVNGMNAQKPNARQARVNMYENAINLDPRRLDVYERLVDALFAIEKPRDEDAKFLSVGLRAFPGEDWLRVGAAFVDYRLEHREAAMTTLDTVLRPESTLDGAQRGYAEGLQHRWLLEAMKSEIDVAVSKPDFAGARVVVGRYRARIGQDNDAASYLNKIDADLEQRQLVASFDAALRANQKAEARVLGQQLLARPQLPADLRRYVALRLRGTK